MTTNIIVAVGNYIPSKGYPIGKNGSLPWKSKADMKWFKETTIGHPVIMGRKTWESLPKSLVDRINIVITSKPSLIEKADNVYATTTLENAIELAKSLSKEDIFIIGGGSIYDYALKNDLVDRIYMDMLHENVPDADTFFPDVTRKFMVSGGESDGDWSQEGECLEIEKSKAYAIVYSKNRGQNNHVDEKYLGLVKDILDHGEERATRAGKTLSVFSRQLRFSLREGLPILTTKKVFTKGVIHELLWFIKGDTNIKYLVENGVHIWDDDAYRYYCELTEKYSELESLSKDDFLTNVLNDKEFTIVRGTEIFHYKYGDLNHVYGYQWTKWGGHNQLHDIIKKLRINPDDRRLIVSAWNVEDIQSMALPPCHFCYQFYAKKMTLEERITWLKEHHGIEVHENIELLDEMDVPKRKLSCMWHQRSVDVGLGFSFNLLSYSILTYMIAQCANMDVDEVIFDGGDVHIYENHVNALKEQLSRNPHMYALPKLELNPNITNIDDFKFEDIRIVGYKSYPTIKMPLSVGM